jgi:hypothetical protein
LQDVDLARGYVAGTMQARNVPGMQQPIETFWEGCIVDDVNHTFYTRAWGASKATDLQHWAKFDGWQDIKCVCVCVCVCLHCVLKPFLLALVQHIAMPLVARMPCHLDCQ